MVELELLQRCQRAVALLDEREATLLGVVRRIEPIVGRDRLAQERQRDEHHHRGGEQDPDDDHDDAGASRATSRRCSRASGHSATIDPNRNTIPAIQIRLTSGFTSTCTKIRPVFGCDSSTIT